MRKADYIIVGQGLAGTFLSWFLIKKGKSVVVVDEYKEFSASRVAAGIIHPITGRRIVKTWLADTLLPFAQKTYSGFESQFMKQIYFPMPVMEILSSPKEYNEWMSRSTDQGFGSYIDSSDIGPVYDEYLQPFFSKIVIANSSYVNIGTLLECFRQHLSAENSLLEEKFDHAHLVFEAGQVSYKEITASKIIFCEGAEAMNNPYWSHLPFLPVKGEVITVRANMKLSHILNRKIYILPSGDHLFRAGATYSWNFKNSLPTEEAKVFLVEQLKTILRIPFEVVDHKAAIRPSAKNRRPFLGLHHQYSQVGIFNGLGTKGCLLAPYFANHLAVFLTGRGKLMEEVDTSKKEKN